MPLGEAVGGECEGWVRGGEEEELRQGEGKKVCTRRGEKVKASGEGKGRCSCRRIVERGGALHRGGKRGKGEGEGD